MGKYDLLMSPVKINSLMLKNHIISTPVGPVDEKAAGGAAMVIEGSVAVDCEKSFWRKDAIYPFGKYEKVKHKQQVDIAHYYGAKIAVELFHAGIWCIVPEGDFAWGPSDDYLVNEKRVIKALDEEHMEEICQAYAKTARDARQLGYDAIFMHFAHGWLASSFLSPYFNHRTDEYGGSIENRSRFPLRILKAVREAVGPYFPIDVRLNANDRVEGNTIKFEDVIEFVKLAEPYIDAVQLSCGQDMLREGNVHMASTNLLPQMYNVDYAAELKKHVKKVLVYAVGAIQTADDAERILEEGKVDLIAMGRELVADPQLPNKILENRVEDIVPCLRCNYCYHIATDRFNQACSVNPLHLREVPKDLKKADEPKNVVVIGAGPAGIKAALTAEAVGHRVTLIEKEREVGGLLRYIAREHYKIEVGRYLKYLKAQLAKSHINIMLNTKADRELIQSLHPDKLIIAIGGELFTPRVKGIDSPIVTDCLSAIEKPETIGDKVVVIGGGVVGIELALGLGVQEGKKVTVVEMTDTYARTANHLYKIAIDQELKKTDNITVMVSTACKEITDKGVVVSHAGEESFIEADTVIIAAGIRPKTAEAHTYYGITPYTDMAGDVVAPRLILEATYEGFCAGNRK